MPFSFSDSQAKRISHFYRQQDTSRKVRSFRQQSVCAVITPPAPIQPTPPSLSPPPAVAPRILALSKKPAPVNPSPSAPPIKVTAQFPQGPAKHRIAGRPPQLRRPRFNPSVFWQGSQPRIAALPHPKPWLTRPPEVQPLRPNLSLLPPSPPWETMTVIDFTPTLTSSPSSFQPVYVPPPDPEPLFPQGPAQGKIRGVRPRLPNRPTPPLSPGSSQTAENLRAIQAQKRRWSPPPGVTSTPIPPPAAITPPPPLETPSVPPPSPPPASESPPLTWLERLLAGIRRWLRS